MTQALLSNTTLSLLEKVAVFGERRHELLAGNIANINTPNYRMRDLPVSEFRDALKSAVKHSRASRTGSTTSAAAETTTAATSRSIDDLFPQRLYEAETAPPNNLTFQDANNRSIEQQTMELTKNTMMQNFAIELLRFQMSALQAVIDERP